LILYFLLNKIIKIFSKQDVAPDHDWLFEQRKMSFTKNLNLTGKYCHHPFNTISINGLGDVFTCICQAWLPISMGKIWEFTSLNGIVNSEKASIIQHSIEDGSYRYCDNTACSIIQENSLLETKPKKTVNWINFSLDESCNLSCPSCRKDFKFIKENSGQFNEKISQVNHIISLIEQHKENLKFTVSGDGDPFASLIYRHFLSSLNLNNRNNIEIELVTNGILVKDFWHKINKIHNNLVRTKISFDAGTASIYEITRRGGNWNKLLDSVKYLVDWKHQTKSNMILTANFVVQRANYRDMKNYVNLCTQLHFDEINFQKIQDWATFDNFSNENIFDAAHKENKEFKQILQDDCFKSKKINFTNITEFYNESI